jgi:hypothetical protein
MNITFLLVDSKYIHENNFMNRESGHRVNFKDKSLQNIIYLWSGVVGGCKMIEEFPERIFVAAA